MNNNNNNNNNCKLKIRKMLNSIIYAKKFNNYLLGLYFSIA